MHAWDADVGRGRLWGPLAVVWVLTLAGVAGAVASQDRFAALALVLVLAVVAGMVGQLVVGEQRGFVLRVAASCGGSLLLVVAGTLAALLLA